MEGLPRVGQPMPEAKPHWGFLPTIDWFWVKVGVKGAVGAVIAVLLLKWINPPGSASIPLYAWLLTIAGRPFLRAGGTGDLRAFQNAFIAALALAGCAFLLFLITPFLADYLVMNLVKRRDASGENSNTTGDSPCRGSAGDSLDSNCRMFRRGKARGRRFSSCAPSIGHPGDGPDFSQA